jgi:hypothetical protein
MRATRSGTLEGFVSLPRKGTEIYDPNDGNIHQSLFQISSLKGDIQQCESPQLTSRDDRIILETSPKSPKMGDFELFEIFLILKSPILGGWGAECKAFGFRTRGLHPFSSIGL